MKVEQIAQPNMDYALQVAPVYAASFAESAFQEISRCIEDGKKKFSPEPVGSVCPDCGTERIEAYPLIETAEYIVSEWSKPNAIVFLAQVDDIIMGASWAYTTNPQELSREKWSDQPEFGDNVVALLALYGITGEFQYDSETFLRSEYRGFGIGRKLVNRVYEVQQSQGLFPIVQRTRIDSPMYRLRQRLGFQQIMGPGTSYSEAENPYRVMFIKK